MPNLEAPRGTVAVRATELRQNVRYAARILSRGRHLILACLLLGLVPSILYLTQATKLYTASTKLLIEDSGTSELVTMDRIAASYRQRPTEGLVLSEVDVLRSSLLARRVIDKLKLWDDPEFNLKLRKPTLLQQVASWLNPVAWLAAISPHDPNEGLSPGAQAEIEKAKITQAFLKQLQILSQRHSYVITAEFTSEDREKAAKIVDTLAKLYVNDRLEASFDDARRVNAWLGDRMESLRHDVTTAETAAEEFRAAHNLRRRGERQATVSDQQLSELNSRLIIARTELAQRQARLDQVRALVRSRGSVETSTAVLESPLIHHLREQESTLQQTISEAAKNYGDRHPKIIGLRAELKELQSKISAEVEKFASASANEVDVAAAGVRTLEHELDTVRGQSNVDGSAEVRLRELERQADVSKGLYEAFLGRFKRDTDQQQVQRANARIIAPATIPIQPSHPRKFAILLIALVGSLGFGVMLVFVLDHLDNAVRSAEEAEDLTGLPILALIPLHQRSRKPVAIDLAERPRSPLADSLRALRVALDLPEAHTPGTVVVVTSSTPKEGKTFAALGLACTLARTGGRVLLIDGDLHRPRLHGELGIAGEAGLAHLLAGSATIDQVLCQGVFPGLDFIPAGQAKAVADLAAPSRVQAVLAPLRQRYTHIVIDLPPVLAVADPRLFARFADSLIYLVRWNATPRDAIRTGLKMLAEADIPVRGIVLSQVDQRKYSRYSYGDYGSYYGKYKEYYGE